MMSSACRSPDTLVGAGRASERSRVLCHRACLAALLLTAPATPSAAHAVAATVLSCDGPSRAHEPSRDLYCIELFPATGMERASGRVELGLGAGPFTVAVTAEGAVRYSPAITLAGLPAPSSLGPYAVYVVWAATPSMDRVRRLGIATAGRTRLDAIDFDKFVIIVSAERSATVSEPTGRIVLRGMSPSTRLQPPELIQFSLGAVRDTAPAGSSAPTDHAHAAHGGASPTGDSSVRWTTVPMPAGLTMLPAEMALRPAAAPYLPRAGAAAAPVRSREIVRLANGDTLRLVAGLVTRTFKGRTLTMFGFNGQHPGPLLDVPQGAEVVVKFENALDQPSTIHWHGVRLENRYDGIPGLTQEAVPAGGRFTYRVRFPDAGIYWYHPHVREDIQQELGLYGNMLVRSPRADYFSPAHREEVLMLDDLLANDEGLVPFGKDSATHALMGRFGNVFLVNGEPRYALRADAGEVVRFYLTNVSNTRTFNLSFPGARMKLVASDVGNYEREEWVESVVIAPAERHVVHVRFDRAGDVPLVNRVHAIDHLFGRFREETDTLGTVSVGRPRSHTPNLAATFARLRTDTATSAELARVRQLAVDAPQRTLVLGLETRGLPFITRQLMQLDSVYFNPVEWSGTMPSMNWASTTDQIRWVIRDPDTGRENMDIDWRFRRGDMVRVRLVNERRSLHAMQHPIHFHGQRFLVLTVNGEPKRNLVWKDTVLIPAGGTVDLLLELSNPGRWMAHCHIAEHLSANMMMGFTVQ